MKNFILLSILFAASFSFAQTPFSMVSSHDEASENLRSLSSSSLNNPWLGAKLVYNVSGDVSESFLLSARVMYVAASGSKYAVPVVGNVALNAPDSLSGQSGVAIGLFPYYFITNSSNLKLLVHGGLNYQILDITSANDNTQFRALAGLEAAFYPSDNGSPITLSVAPEFIWNIGDVNDTKSGLGITGIIPVANGLGILFESLVPFDNEVNTGFQIGVIVNGSIK